MSIKESTFSYLADDIEVIREDGSLLFLSLSNPESDEKDKDSDNDSIIDLFTSMSEESFLDKDDDTDSRTLMKLDELISMESSSLELIKSVNVSMGKCITAAVKNTFATMPEQKGVVDTKKSTSVALPISNPDNSSKNEDESQIQSDAGEPRVNQNIIVVNSLEGNDSKGVGNNMDRTGVEATVTPQKPSQNTFRGLPTFRRRKPGQRTAMAVNDFIKDYYRSLDTVIRYIIIASLLSFVTAFTLLYFHGSQTHQHNIEMFKMKDKESQAQLEHYKVTKSQSINFRETVIHQRYEETRLCQVSLMSCSTNNEALTIKIAKVEKDSSALKLNLETELKSKDGRINQLQEAVKSLEDANKELRRCGQ